MVRINFNFVRSYGTRSGLIERSHHRTGQFSSYDRDLYCDFDERQWGDDD